MKKVIKVITLIILTAFLILTNCDHKTVSKKEDINEELKKVILEVREKEKITAGELRQDDIRAYGFNANIYAVHYEKIEADSNKQEALITVSLKKAGTESVSKVFTIGGFKIAEQHMSNLELINIEADKVVLQIPNIENITFDELTTDKVIASGHKKDYTIEYSAKKYDPQTKEAEISFYLEKDNLRSKITTFKLSGFKEAVLPEGSADIKEGDLFAALSLTETKITASAAAKKIKAASNKTIGDFIFEENTILNYDDKKGIFTIYIKGTYQEKPFSKKMRISGFYHPYINQPESVYKKNPDFTIAIEENLLIEDYIKKANADIENFFKEGLSFMLHKGNRLVNEIIVLGEHDSYSMTAELEKIDSTTLKIIPIFNIKYKFKNDVSETEKEEIETFSLARFLNPIKYFTEKEVYDHILSRLNNPEAFIKINPRRFASEFYAKAMVMNITPGDLFNESAIEKYRKVYTENSPKAYLNFPDLHIALYNIRNGGIEPDDYAGSLTLSYYVASSDLISDPDQTNFALNRKTLKVTGFRKADEETIKDLFSFVVIRGQDKKGAPGTLESWRRKNIPENTYLLRQGNGIQQGDWYMLSSETLNRGNSSGFYMALNGVEDLTEHLANIEKFFLSVGRSGELVLITNISLKKPAKSDYLDITMHFMGNGDPITLTTNPYIPRN
ncbi:hypothetical protein E4O00_01045 [Treponema sp. OMZ 788]|uniref:lipoprotein 17-related variable surface protein n=1 Tax=Treponema sp. OMZ 788 TaxID=2563664 RepID=UPI0020A2BA0B|nr:lipoprotein 17-related variable surface protein [Treponema sp. OMZ 788]UTC64845.1 hypothetical protein E4O00_01045 [Treponema sp. OMZ 788]